MIAYFYIRDTHFAFTSQKLEVINLFSIIGIQSDQRSVFANINKKRQGAPRPCLLYSLFILRLLRPDSMNELRQA